MPYARLPPRHHRGRVAASGARSGGRRPSPTNNSSTWEPGGRAPTPGHRSLEHEGDGHRSLEHEGDGRRASSLEHEGDGRRASTTRATDAEHRAREHQTPSIEHESNRRHQDTLSVSEFRSGVAAATLKILDARVRVVYLRSNLSAAAQRKRGAKWSSRWGPPQLGWMHEILRESWGRKAPAWITREAFDRQLDAILRQERAARKRERAEFLVSVTEEERSAARSSPFVERLIEVEIEEEDIRRAIDCYLRFSSERFRLAAEGDITVAEWDDFYFSLSERWAGIARRLSRNRGAQTDEQLGNSIYFETADRDYLAPLAGRQTEHYYFTSGGYHRLADNDRVWWLPTYQSRPDGSKKGGGL